MNKNRSPVKLALYNTIQHGSGFTRNATVQMSSTWRRTVRDRGGYWIGMARWDGSRAEMVDVFTSGMGWQLMEQANGLTTWHGYLAEMRLRLDGMEYRRSLPEVTNRVKTIYSKIGKNQITNPSCEAAAWDAYGSPSVRERSATWSSEGVYSTHVVAEVNAGVVIQAAIAIESELAYQCHVSVNIVSGTWKLEIYKPDGGVVDFTQIGVAGKSQMYVGIMEMSLAAGNVGLRLYCTTASGEIYADAAVFQLAPARAETGWYEDVVSQAEYGLMEEIVSQAGITDAAADALTVQTLKNRAWANTQPGGEIAANDGRADQLDLVFLGHVYLLRNRMTGLRGESTASTIIQALLNNVPELGIDVIADNSLVVAIDDREVYDAWSLILDVTRLGDAEGNRWICGVGNERRFYYRRADDNIMAHAHAGRLQAGGGGPLEGWLAMPGLVMLDDLPTANMTTNLPAGLMWMGEVEFDLGAWMAGKNSVRFREVA